LLRYRLNDELTSEDSFKPAYALSLQLGKSLKYSLAVDAGCGPGLMSTVLLAPYFDKVLGVDISESQIEQATLNNEHSNIEYR